MRRLTVVSTLTRDQRGFTLVETLVATISAVAIVAALYAVLDISVQQSAKITDMSQATQLGRTTMVKLSEGLGSACIASGFVPVREGIEPSGHEKAVLQFINATSKEAEISDATMHEIVWEKSKGLLVDKQYEDNGGSWPNFTWNKPTLKREVRLGEDISEVEKGKKEYTPIFQYYKYKEKTSSIKSASTTNGLNTLEAFSETEVDEGLSKIKGKKTKDANEEVSAIEISFNQAPVDKYTAEDRAVDFKNQITFSFTVPNAENPDLGKPCE